MAISTTHGHVARAVSFAQSPEIFLGLGRKTPWPNTDNNGNEIPNVPTVSITSIEEPLGFRRIDKVCLVVPNANGEIEYKDGRWSIVSQDQAYAMNAKHVYIECSVSAEDLPLDSYRQIGVITGLVRKSSVSPGKYALVPSEVENQGILQVVDNRRPVTRQANQREQISLILEF